MRRTKYGLRRALAYRLSASAMSALGVFSLGACSKTAPPPPPPPLVVTAHPLQQQVIDWDDFVGRFEAVDSVDLRPRVSGYLNRIDFHDGDIVRKGQVLFEIDPRPYEAALNQARGVETHDQAALNDATIERKRAEGLFAATPSASRS